MAILLIQFFKTIDSFLIVQAFYTEGSTSGMRNSTNTRERGVYSEGWQRSTDGAKSEKGTRMEGN